MVAVVAVRWILQQSHRCDSGGAMDGFSARLCSRSVHENSCSFISTLVCSEHMLAVSTADMRLTCMAHQDA